MSERSQMLVIRYDALDEITEAQATEFLASLADDGIAGEITETRQSRGIAEVAAVVISISVAVIAAAHAAIAIRKALDAWKPGGVLDLRQSPPVFSPLPQAGHGQLHVIDENGSRTETTHEGIAAAAAEVIARSAT